MKSNRSSRAIDTNNSRLKPTPNAHRSARTVLEEGKIRAHLLWQLYIFLVVVKA